MPIRFSKLGSTLRIGSTSLVVTAGLWFGSTAYAQTNGTTSSLISPAPSLKQALNEGNDPSTQWQAPRSMSPAASMQTQRLDLNGVSGQAAERLLRTGIVSPQAIVERPRQRPVVTESLPDFARPAVESLTRPAVSAKPKVATVAYNTQVANHTGVHQLSSISVLQFEQKLVGAFGDQLAVKSSDDGRFVRVAIQDASDRSATPASMVMLVDLSLIHI